MRSNIISSNFYSAWLLAFRPDYIRLFQRSTGTLVVYGFSAAFNEWVLLDLYCAANQWLHLFVGMIEYCIDGLCVPVFNLVSQPLHVYVLYFVILI